MFSYQHFIWLGICILLQPCYYFLFKKVLKKLSFNQFLYLSSAIVLFLELILNFGMMYYVPYAENNKMYGYYAPYFEPRDFPLHLCSIQFLTLFIAAYTKNESLKKRLLAFLYPTTIFGGIIATIIPDVFTYKTPVDWWMSQSFISPVYYSFFIVHSYLVYVGFRIGTNKEIDFHFKDNFKGSTILLGLGILSLFVNSIFTVVERDPETGVVTKIISNSNLFFTYDLPISGIILTEKWQWFIYFIILITLVVVIFMLFYIPFYIKDRKLKKEQIPSNSKATD